MKKKIAIITSAVILVSIVASLSRGDDVFAAVPDIGDLPKSVSIVSRWKLDEESGERADSGDGVAQNLTDVNTVLYGAGQFDANAADFEASNSESLTKADSSQLSLTGDMSFFAWVKLESLAGTPLVISKSLHTGNQRAYYFYLCGTADDCTAYGVTSGHTGMVFYASPSGDGTGQAQTGKTWDGTTGSWYQIGFSYDASEGSAEFFSNGESLGTATGLPNSIADTTATFLMSGYETGGQYYDGLMQDAIIWNTALTSSEVSSMYSTYIPSASKSKGIIIIQSLSDFFSA